MGRAGRDVLLLLLGNPKLSLVAISYQLSAVSVILSSSHFCLLIFAL